VWIAALREAAQMLPTETTCDGGSAEATSSHSERRDARRYPIAIDALCRQVLGRTDANAAEIQDISATGACLQMRRRFEVGTVLAVQLLDEPGVAMAPILARARWVRQAPDQRWQVGCAFHCPLTEDELTRLVECKTATVAVQTDLTT
jgi:hypothetical protein